MYFKKIPGQRLYLSPICSDDMEQYAKWLNDSSVSDNLGSTSQVLTVEKEKSILEDLSKSGYTFAIIKEDDNSLIGNIGLFDINHICRNAQCGLFIGEKENRNKGYGREALTLLLEYGFDTLNLNNVMLKVFSYNEIAISCYKRVGFKIIGERRNSYYINGAYYNDVYMDILASEFRDMKRQ